MQQIKKAQSFESKSNLGKRSPEENLAEVQPNPIKIQKVEEIYQPRILGKNI
jgi:hypothetical protein